MPAAPIILENTRAQLGSDLAKIDTGEAQRRLTRNFSERALPQLQSSIGARGQFYSGARQRAEKQASENFLDSSYDVQSALQRQLDDFTRNRMYAAFGVLV